MGKNLEWDNNQNFDDEKLRKKSQYEFLIYKTRRQRSIVLCRTIKNGLIQRIWIFYKNL